MGRPLTVAICSHRLGGTDGVSIESQKWSDAFVKLGHSVRTVAGSGTADIIVPELCADATAVLHRKDLDRAFEGTDLVVVENVCSLKLNPTATQTVAESLAGRPAVLHHHDLAIERPDRRHLGPPPTDPCWAHVCINNLARQLLANNAITATTLHNRFDPNPPLGDRIKARRLLDVDDNEFLVLQPTRAIARKAVPVGLGLAEALGATYWLLGAAEDGYGDELDNILRRAKTRVIRPGPDTATVDIDDAYAACDLVTLPSTWEGFGNPAIESATHLRPLAIGDYPIGQELMAYGFRWFSADDAPAVKAFIASSNDELVHHNAAVARAHFSLEDLPAEIAAVLAQLETVNTA